MMTTNGASSYQRQHVAGDVASDAGDGTMSMDVESFLSILNEDHPHDSSQSGLAYPSLSIAPCNESTSLVAVNEHSQTHNGPLQDVSSMRLSSSTLGDFDFSSSSYYDISETNSERSIGGGTFGINDGDANHQLIDKPEITDVIHCRTLEAHENMEIPFIDFSGYSNIPYNTDDGNGDHQLMDKSEITDVIHCRTSEAHECMEVPFTDFSGYSNIPYNTDDGNGDHQSMDKSEITDVIHCRTSEAHESMEVPFTDFSGYSNIPYNADDGNSNHQSMDKSEITDVIHCRTSEAHENMEVPFTDFSGYSNILYNMDDGNGHHQSMDKSEIIDVIYCRTAEAHENMEVPVTDFSGYSNIPYNTDDGNGNHQLVDNSEITDVIHSSTPEAHENMEVPFIDFSGYSDIPDDESSMPYIMNRNEPSYSSPHSMISYNGMLFDDMIVSEQHLMHNVSSNSASDEAQAERFGGIPSRGSTNGRQTGSIMNGCRTGDVGCEKYGVVANRLSTDKVCLKPFPGALNSTSRNKHVVTGDQGMKRSDHFIKSRNSSFADNHGLNDTLINKQQVTYIDVDDPDICILEDMSETAPNKQSPIDGKPPIAAQSSSLGAPPTQMEFNDERLKVNDERFIYQVALQDLSQPKSEAFAPDGALVVNLLRHQRIALSWMVQKETKSMHCFGGFLADDQGLGKTLSTIALILKERSPSCTSIPNTEVKKSKTKTKTKTKTETQTVNLDDDDDVTELDKLILKSNSHRMETNKSLSSSVDAKSRLAAGTLIVCPTSVLRQWNDELHNKVSREANLSVLVYHGANRTKDPSELAKYDVVLTTYAIVSMEVPKQPLVDEEDDETKELNNFLPVGLLPGKKRKYPPSSSKSKKKDKKGMDNELFESLARPLAKVRWFRVVLDEAQSIKNHRTQVARACWGLRAKRRWCLSGTPIQNAIDDLYSYFRFFRYDPYAVYNSFCSTIKVPIQRDPGTGYKKLQAVLKTIMLRRTKATLLDGVPIISLPPKTVNLKKVDFTAEERDFYRRLEADSRAQFKEYAAAGTVKQNYVNILLMLLRLRQACDHPLLVKGCSSSSKWKSSLDKAKKLPLEKRSRLLSCLEASLAICGICSDPPEDAVVTTCEHVFCNQCILEHLSSDDSQCPSLKCKVILSPSLVFSKSTLKISLGGQSGSLKAEVLEPSGSISSSNVKAAEALDSSKIKAAIEVLNSIAKPREIPGKDSNKLSGGFDKDANLDGNLVAREKAIVFSQWTRMLDLVEACLKDSCISYRRLDGTMSVVTRDKAVKDFNTLPEVSVMIMSLKAASLGLNMVAACHVLLLDLWWNPTTEDQAIDRAHRIGQTRPVSVLRLTVKDTVEDRILALQQKKREMVSSAFGEDETGTSQTRLTVDDLKYLFQA